MKVALDPTSPLTATHATHGAARSPAPSPGPPGLHLSASAMAAEPSCSSGPPGLLAPSLAQPSGGSGRPRSPLPPGQWNGPVPQVKLGQPSVVNMSWRTVAEASPDASGASPSKSAAPARAPSYSQGSALHDSGGCEPCAWFWKPAGCRNAADCKRCHLCEEGALKDRKKAKVAMMRTKTSEAEEACTSAGPGDLAVPEELQDAPPAQLQDAPPVEPQVQPQADAAEPAEPAEPEQLNNGSRLHVTGECEPCAWFWRPTGCSHGLECRRCHLCPEGEVKARKKKKLALLRRSREEGAAGETSISLSVEESDG